MVWKQGISSGVLGHWLGKRLLFFFFFVTIHKQGISVYVTQNVEPSPSSMKEIILCAGGQVGVSQSGKNGYHTLNLMICLFIHVFPALRWHSKTNLLVVH